MKYIYDNNHNILIRQQISKLWPSCTYAKHKALFLSPLACTVAKNCYTGPAQQDFEWRGGGGGGGGGLNVNV